MDDKELLELGATEAGPEQEDAELQNLGASVYQPSAEEQQKMADFLHSSQPSEGTSTLRGAEQGLTFGFADELGGAMGAGLEGTVNAFKEGSLAPLNDSNLERLYKEYRDANRARYKAAEEAHPNYFTGGAVAGGALVPAGAFGKLGQLGAKASLGTKVAKGIGMGATAGGLQAAGNTEESVVQDGMINSEFARDAYEGARGGAILGGSLPLAGATAKGAYGLAKVAASPVIKGMKQGLRGINLLGDDAERSVQSNIAKYGKEITSDIQGNLNNLGKQKKKLIEDAEKAGIRINESDIDSFVESRLGTTSESNLPEVQRELNQFQELLRSAKEGKLIRREKQLEVPTGQEKLRHVEELKMAEQAAIESGVDPADIETVFEPVDVEGKVAGVIRQKLYKEDPDTGNLIENGYKKLASRLIEENEVPQFKTLTETVRAGDRDLTKPQELYQLYKDLKQRSTFGDSSFKTHEVSKVTGGTMQDVQGLLRGSVEGLETTDAKIASLKQGAKLLGMEDTVNVDKQAMMNKVIDLVNQQEQVGAPGSKAREKLAEFANSIRAEHPEIAAQVETKIKDLGEQAFLSKGISGLSDLGKANTVKRLAGAAGNVAGLGVYNLAKLPPEALMMRVQQIASKGGKASQELSKILSQLPNKNERERNAILFGLMQNPAYRQYLQEEDPAEEVK